MCRCYKVIKLLKCPLGSISNIQVEPLVRTDCELNPIETSAECSLINAAAHWLVTKPIIISVAFGPLLRHTLFCLWI